MNELFRRLPLFKGKERLARFFLRRSIREKIDFWVVGKHDCTYLLPNILENVGFDIYINGEYEGDIQDLLYRLIPPKGCFLDLGANIGSIVIPLSKRRPDIQSIAVEAAPWIFNYLERNVFTNKLGNVQLVNKALFNKDDWELDFFSPQDKFGKGSLSPVFTKEGVKVKTIKIDTLVKEFHLKKVDVIKIDVEGFEYFAFNGGEELLSGADAPVIIFEFVDWAEKQAMGLEAGAAQRLLIEKGYYLYQIKGKKLLKQEDSLTTGASNLIASKKEVFSL